jgi:hypothetical protein
MLRQRARHKVELIARSVEAHAEIFGHHALKEELVNGAVFAPGEVAQRQDLHVGGPHRGAHPAASRHALERRKGFGAHGDLFFSRRQFSLISQKPHLSVNRARQDGGDLTHSCDSH